MSEESPTVPGAGQRRPSRPLGRTRVFRPRGFRQGRY